MKKRYLSERVYQLPESGLKEFFDVASTMEGVISLGVGEPDFETPLHVREAAIANIREGNTKYTSNAGMIELRTAISHYLRERFDLSYNPNNEILITIGVSQAIDLALRAILDPGDEVLIISPSYVSYQPCVTLCGGVPVLVPTWPENNFKVRPEDIQKKITKKTKAIILPYPSNPTGAIMEKEDLKKIIPVIIENDLVVISDEVYAELTYGTNHVSVAAFPDMKERTLVLNGFSKSFAMTGWRLGYVAGGEELIGGMSRIYQYVTMCASTTTQIAGLEAISSDKREDNMKMMRDSYDERRRFMLESFTNMGLECFEPKGAFFMFPSIRETGMTSLEFCRNLLEKQKVAVVPGNSFGEYGEGFIRCSYAYSMEQLEVCLERIRIFVEEHIKRRSL